jgi:hypothetical protein
MTRCAMHRTMSEGLPTQLDISWSGWFGWMITHNMTISTLWHIVGVSAVEGVNAQTSGACVNEINS